MPEWPCEGSGGEEGCGPPHRLRCCAEAIVYLGVVSTLLLLPFTASSKERPNVLFIIVDDLNTRIASYGAPLVESPNIDRLAARGVLFSRAYAQIPLCNPSRVSFLTGLYPAKTRVVYNRERFRIKNPGVVTLPEYFRKHGYTSASAGKIFHRDPDSQRSWDEIARLPSPQPEPTEPSQTNRERSDRWVAAAGGDEGHRDHQIANAAIELLEKHKAGPFFIAVGFVRPHTPLIAPKKYFGPYEPSNIPLPIDFSPEITLGEWLPPLALGHNGDLFMERKATRQEAREMIAAYYACVSFIDAQVGRVLAKLGQLDLWDDTIVVFSSDHGFHLGEKGKWSKHVSHYDPATRVPLIVFAPGVSAAGQVSPRTVELVSLYPTLVELAGLPMPKGMQGPNLLPLLKDPQAAWNHAAFTWVAGPAGIANSVRTERYRYTEWQKWKKNAELIDYSTDPNELANVAQKPEYRKTTLAMKRLLRAKLDSLRKAR